jgi:hypothetical protein
MVRSLKELQQTLKDTVRVDTKGRSSDLLGYIFKGILVIHGFLGFL